MVQKSLSGWRVLQHMTDAAMIKLLTSWRVLQHMLDGAKVVKWLASNAA